MRSADSWKRSMIIKLSTGRAPCSSVVWKDRLIVMGARTSWGGDSSGDALSNHKTNNEIPKCSIGSVASSSIVLLKDKYLYAIFRHSGTGREELHVADMDQLESWLSRVFGFLFKNFWQRVTILKSREASIAARTGTIYSVGGCQKSTSTGWLFSSTEDVAVKCVAKFDNDSRYWIPLADMIHARTCHETFVYGNYLYAVGGKDEKGKSLASVERLNLSSSRSVWEEATPMTTGRDNFGADLIFESIVVVAGGFSNGRRLKTVEYFDITNPGLGWRSLPSLPEARTNCSLSFFESQLVIAGGLTGFGVVPMDSVETLNILEVHSAPQKQELQNAILVSQNPEQADDVPYADAVLEVIPPYTAEVGQMATPVFDEAIEQSAACRLQASAPPQEESEALAQVACDDDNSCAVCLARPKQVAFYCGHQACSECSPLLEECHSCRLPIKGRIQLFG